MARKCLMKQEKPGITDLSATPGHGGEGGI